MPQMNGIDALELFKEKLPAARILMLSMHDSREYISTSVMYGAAGYILKDVATRKRDRHGYRDSGGGHLFLGRGAGLADGAIGRWASAMTTGTGGSAADCRGQEQSGYGCLAGISEHTVETHRKNIKRKLRIATTAGPDPLCPGQQVAGALMRKLPDGAIRGAWSSGQVPEACMA